MSDYDPRFPVGFPERRLDPIDRDDGSRWALPRAQPRHFTCCCGKPAWRFPEAGVGFCGFCPASAADLEARAAARDREDIDDERQARSDREEGHR